MNPTRLSWGLDGPSPVQLTADELAELLASAEVVREEKTGVAGAIRILNVGGRYFVQEKTPDRMILVRPRPDLDQAMGFVEHRLQTYERMWDG